MWRLEQAVSTATKEEKQRGADALRGAEQRVSKQEGVNFDAMVGVVRELGVGRRDLDAAARRAGLDGEEAQFLRSKVGLGRGHER